MTPAMRTPSEEIVKIGRRMAERWMTNPAGGNIVVQMIAAGDLANLDQGRQLVRASFPTETYMPVDSDVWGEQYDRYLKVTGLI